MQIQGPAHVHGPQSIRAPHRAPATAGAQAAQGFDTVDELSLSPQADAVAKAMAAPEIRANRVAELRAQIASGAYETEERLNGALDRLLDEIG